MNLANKDFWAGLLLVVTGAGAFAIARGYPMGTALRMGAGYFPMVLGGLLVVLGGVLMLRAIRSTDSLHGPVSWRALIILPLALCLFGFLVDRAGFVPAMLVIVIGSALAGTEFKVIEVLALAVALTALSVAVFIYGLGLPYPLIAGWY